MGRDCYEKIFFAVRRCRGECLFARAVSITDLKNNRQNSDWEYGNLGLELHFSWNVVTGITIYPNGDRRLDWSGLSAKSSQADFERKYNTSMSRRGNIDIGHGELIRMNKIRFGNDGVYLGIFTSGYVF